MLTHIDDKKNPTMVDITEKSISTRFAEAETLVQLPEELRPYFQGGEITVKKGPIFHTAIIAGTMAAKKTHEAIPFCHQIPVESCKIAIECDDSLLVRIRCRVKTTFKTGVEMEALHGATVAALTVYDMAKAVSHRIVIRETKLLAKTGGKRTVLDKPLYGLVLTGGRSTRMKSDKALIDYRGKPQAEVAFEVLEKFCDATYLSARKGQWEGGSLARLPTIFDQVEDQGPMGGILAAFTKHPDAYWLVVACDLVHFDETTVRALLAHFDPAANATCFRHRKSGLEKHDGEAFPEALCAIYTPKGHAVLANAMAQDRRCPVKLLREQGCHLVDAPTEINLSNINTPEESERARHEIR